MSEPSMAAAKMPAPGPSSLSSLVEKLEHAATQLEQARSFNKARYQMQVLEISQRLIAHPGGIESLYRYAPRLDSAGIFAGTDWAQPQELLAGLVRNTLEQANKGTIILESLSQLRLLAIARGEHKPPGISAEQARHYLTQVLALNLDILFGHAGEALRVRLGAFGSAIEELLHFQLDFIGYEDILGSLLDEIWRILAQRPIHVTHVKAMITQVSIALTERSSEIGEARFGVDRLISALFGPTQGCLADPGLPAYREQLNAMDAGALQQEAYGFARAMHDTGLVSDYHAEFLRWLLENNRGQMIPDALGLSSTGLDAFRSYHELIHSLINTAIYPQTAQAVYGLAMLLERGILYNPPIAPGLWRQIGMQLSHCNQQSLKRVYGDQLLPEVYLLAGVISLLGLPFGVGQGNNPTCQSVRAISMWSYNDPDYLLYLLYRAGRFDDVAITFEGKPIASAALPLGLASNVILDTDPVSQILVPHLDRIYSEMGRLCSDRGEDPHRWINPEFHGWWVGRDFLIAVDISDGKLLNFDAFLRQFYISYHPYYNGNQPLIHPQPAGIAVTDSNARFVGWHAITIVRVALDQEGVMRVYFFNPNNDSGQNWGNGVIVSTHGKGERYGEASLPFEQLAARLYIFHDDPIDASNQHAPSAQELEAVKCMVLDSWARDR